MSQKNHDVRVHLSRGDEVPLCGVSDASTTAKFLEHSKQIRRLVRACSSGSGYDVQCFSLCDRSVVWLVFFFSAVSFDVSSADVRTAGRLLLFLCFAVVSADD